MKGLKRKRTDEHEFESRSRSNITSKKCVRLQRNRGRPLRRLYKPRYIRTFSIRLEAMRRISVTTELLVLVCHYSQQGASSKQVVEKCDPEAERTAQT